MLGDLRTVDFAAIAAGGANRKNFLERVQQYLRMWETNPKVVNAERIRKEFDNIRPLMNLPSFSSSSTTYAID